MKLVWTERAEADLDGQCRYIAESDPVGALSLGVQVFERIGALADNPCRGRSGRVDGTRELPLPGLPWIAVYEIDGDTVFVLRLLHGAQMWPKE